MRFGNDNVAVPQLVPDEIEIHLQGGGCLSVTSNPPPSASERSPQA